MKMSMAIPKFSGTFRFDVQWMTEPVQDADRSLSGQGEGTDEAWTRQNLGSLLQALPQSPGHAGKMRSDALELTQTAISAAYPVHSQVAFRSSLPEMVHSVDPVSRERKRTRFQVSPAVYTIIGPDRQMVKRADDSMKEILTGQGVRFRYEA